MLCALRPLWPITTSETQSIIIISTILYHLHASEESFSKVAVRSHMLEVFVEFFGASSKTPKHCVQATCKHSPQSSYYTCRHTCTPTWRSTSLSILCRTCLDISNMGIWGFRHQRLPLYRHVLSQMPSFGAVPAQATRSTCTIDVYAQSIHLLGMDN